MPPAGVDVRALRWQDARLIHNPRMAFPLGSLGAQDADAAAPAPAPSGRGASGTYTRKPKAPPPPPAPPRWRLQLNVFLGALGLILLLLAMATHSPSDAAWSTTGDGAPTRNAAGVLGAWVSDLLLFLFGFSAWWIVLIAVRSWLSALARLLRRRFPGATIVEQPAHEVLQQIDPGDDAVALVSSLPFRSLPAPWREAAREAIETFLVAHPRCRLVQYTYQPRVPFELVHADRLAWRRRTWVWRNAPPAWVWELEAAAPSAA